MATITARAQHTIEVLRELEFELPFGECNGNYHLSFANAVALLGKPIEDYTVGELLALGKQHQAQWIQDARAFNDFLLELDAERTP